ncbi:riboflavin synthase [Magnetofaba australis]|uniref:Riboflavin synthase n=1 Tax=Magnetofaba australis IT-1 TaxID=1434232 RepID=A0A1Y2K8D8_9PROT|nr:riboflavin synthase [Magnetofaba australis]OSM06262.1 putative riboflavin synthase subunit alpha [Magnetofaba australis IT-1]
MFTGLIETVGAVASVERSSGDWKLTVSSDLPMGEVKLGDSIAVSGACLTVIAMGGATFTVEVSQESVGKTWFPDIGPGRPVNLERAMALGGRLDGHLVQGHVDVVGAVERIAPRGRSTQIWFRVPAAFGRYIIPKGSIAIDGVSLTVNEVIDDDQATRFSINVIPLTQQKTTLGNLSAGSKVNIETDLLGRYVERLLKHGGACRAKGDASSDEGGSGGGLTEAYLRDRGFA